MGKNPTVPSNGGPAPSRGSPESNAPFARGARIALDAMGGDHAPAPEVEGALAAIRERPIEVVLVGDEPLLRQMIGAPPAGPGRIVVRHASQVIGMDDQPAAAFKTKKDSSMRVCFNLAAAGEADAVVSAGNSGAMLAGGLFVMKRIAGLERPGIMTLSPAPGRQCVAIDVGANTEVRPVQLAQFAVLGSVYARLMLGCARPRVGVLSNGDAQALLHAEESSSNFRIPAAAVEFVNDGVFLVDGDGIVRLWNPAAANTFRVKATKAIGRR